MSYIGRAWLLNLNGTEIEVKNHPSIHCGELIEIAKLIQKYGDEEERSIAINYLKNSNIKHQKAIADELENIYKNKWIKVRVWGVYSDEITFRISDVSKADAAITQFLKRHKELQNCKITIINEEGNMKMKSETISTGLKKLDEVTKGFHKSDLIAIGARPGMGKTTFAINLAENIAMSGKKCVFFSLELSNEQLAKKFSTVNSDMEIYIDDTPGITVSEMNQKIKDLKNVDCVVIDYFGLIRPEIKRTDRIQECHDISRKLRKMANELDIPIICTTTVARNENYGERPRFSNLLDGGRLEFYADIFMFLHRNSYYFCEIDEDDIEGHTTELIIAKNKHGSTETIELNFDDETKRFIELGIFNDYEICYT